MAHSRHPRPQGIRRPQIGERFQAAEGSGPDSRRTGTRVADDSIPSSHWKAYPHVGGKRQGWVAVRWDNGDADTFPLNRMIAGKPKLHQFNPRKRRRRSGSVRAVRSDFFVSVWEERDRLHIALKVGKEGEWDTTVVDWWDDDARSMFEDGFFKARDLENSVIAYAEEMGLIEVL